MPAVYPDVDNTKTKKLVVCCDGTWMNGDGGKNRVPSNVTRLARAIKPTDSNKHPQIVYYQAGIGTGLGLWSQLAGGGAGLGFSENVREAYAFLANNYHQDAHNPEISDSIFLIGFSRGAYTARSLGGLVGQLGLLTKENMGWFYDIFEDWQNAGNADHTPVFWKRWSQYQKDIHNAAGHTLKTSHGSLKTVNDYLEEYRYSLLAHGLTQEATVSAIGVFDTVGALGIPINPWLQKLLNLPGFVHSYKWVDTSLDKHVKNAFQALALDEHRSPFYPAVWERPDDCPTNLKQVWFAGAHSSIGGAYPDVAQANITLAWMMDQLSGDEIRQRKPLEWSVKDWLDFDVDYLKEQRLVNLHYQSENGGERSWGMGAIYNSLTFPQILAGSRTRHPGRTHPVLYPSEREDPTRLLKNTNERVHASVRVRINRAGRDFERNPTDSLPRRVAMGAASLGLGLMRTVLGRKAKPYYHPQQRGPLQGWEPRDGFMYHDEYAFNLMDVPDEVTGKPPFWEYTGSDPLFPKGMVMTEDTLGSHEKILLSEYKECADWIESSNVGKRSVDDHPEGKRDSIQHKMLTL